MSKYFFLIAINNIAKATLKGGLRTKVFLTLVILSVFSFIVIIPSFASFSMRQVREVATSLSISLISFVQIVLAIFLGIQLAFKDIENRISHLTLSYPISRDIYVLGKFIGIVMILGISLIIFLVFSTISLIIADGLYEGDLPINWENFFLSVIMEFLKTLIITSFALLFGSFSTNFFLPLFGTIGIYIVGSVNQTVYDYINSIYGKKLPYISIVLSKISYYILPNLSVFDYKFCAIYNLPIDINKIFLVVLYALLYITIIISLSIIIFRRREMF